MPVLAQTIVGGVRSSAAPARRNEWKFFVPDMLYSAVASDSRQFLQRDPHAGADGRYLVRTMYFDTPFLGTYHARLNGNAFRSRLRLRRYETAGQPPSDWFLEVKGKANVTCFKTHRAVLSDDVVRDHLRHHGTLSIKHLIERDAAPLGDHLAELWSQNLQPKLLVLYDREPLFDARKPEFRVTFDSHIRSVSTRDPYERVSPTRRILDSVVMEAKFGPSMPMWLHAIIQKYALRQVGVSKYCLGIDSRFSAAPDLDTHVQLPVQPAGEASPAFGAALRALLGLQRPADRVWEPEAIRPTVRFDT